MPQYQIGTIDITNGSNIVTGNGTYWLMNIKTGDSFMVVGVNAHYQVASINSDTQITLSKNWADFSLLGATYAIARDFTQNYNIPETWFGDREWPYRITQAFRLIDSRIKILSDRIETKGTTTTTTTSSSTSSTASTVSTTSSTISTTSTTSSTSSTVSTISSTTTITTTTTTIPP